MKYLRLFNESESNINNDINIIRDVVNSWLDDFNFEVSEISIADIYPGPGIFYYFARGGDKVWGEDHNHLVLYFDLNVGAMNHLKGGGLFLSNNFDKLEDGLESLMDHLLVFGFNVNFEIGSSIFYLVYMKNCCNSC